jgi:parallel beta-helix repeat protein
MRKRSCILVLALSLFWGGRAAYGDFYVISGGRGAGTGITSLPYTITAPGFYYLTKNLSHNGTAITVNADNVTIDLMGFSLIGPGKESGSNYGILMSGRTNVEIRNGSITGFGSSGIRDSELTGNHHRVINVRVIGNGGMGISFYGYGIIIEGCTVSDNDGIGILPGNGGCLVKGNAVYNNASHGIYVTRCLVTNNSVYGNGGMNIAPITGGLVSIENYAP